MIENIENNDNFFNQNASIESDDIFNSPCITTM